MSAETLEAVYGPRTTEGATRPKVVASGTMVPGPLVVSDTPSQEAPTEETDESGTLYRQWHGTWLVQNLAWPDGTRRIDIDADGFRYRVSASGGAAGISTTSWRGAGDKRAMPRYVTYTEERLTRDELVTRHEAALADYPAGVVTPREFGEQALAGLRPGRYKVVANLERYDNSYGERYILDDDVLITITDCNSVLLNWFARQ